METPSLSQVLSSPDDNCMDYVVYPDESVQGSEEGMAEFLMTLNAAAVFLGRDYLWQKEPFFLKRDPTSKSFLGQTHYGDTVEDEWFVVHILRQLTVEFPDIVVRVTDQDGEFLLIEAADHLPKWAESDASCQQRVYIHQGNVHLVESKSGRSLQVTDSESGQEPEPISIPDAVSLVRTRPDETVANDGIQEAISKRIGTYPDKMLENTHYANIMLPSKLTLVLKSRPDFVSSAIRAFYYRDPIDMKSARLMRNVNPGDDLVRSRVRFTKTLYAMLSSQEFRPDTKSGWTFPLPTSVEFKAHSLGAKLALGFEILLSRGAAKTNSSSGSEFTSSAAWHRYEEKLKGYNYYKGFLEGSKPYKELQERAKGFFQTSLNEDGNEHPEDLVVMDLQGLMEKLEVDLATLKNEEASLPPDDDESWLMISADEFESLLEAQFKTKISDQKLDQIPEKLKEFMSQISDFKGVEVPSSSRNGGSVGCAGSSLDEAGVEPLDFRADDFVSALDKLLLELGKPDKEWDGSDDEYYSDEDENDLNLEEIKKLHTFSKDSKIHELMKEMDAELEETEVGKSFVTSIAGPSRLGQAAAASARVEELDEFDNCNADSSPYEPVDIDMNALANMLESFQSQEEPSGPSVNLLRSVGFDLTKAKK